MRVGEAVAKSGEQTGNGAKGTGRGFISSRYLPIVSQRPLKWAAGCDENFIKPSEIIMRGHVHILASSHGVGAGEQISSERPYYLQPPPAKSKPTGMGTWGGEAQEVRLSAREQRGLWVEEATPLVCSSLGFSQVMDSNIFKWILGKNHNIKLGLCFHSFSILGSHYEKYLVMHILNVHSFQFVYLFTCLFVMCVYMCMHVHAHTNRSEHDRIEIWRQLAEVSFLLQPCRFQGLNLGHQTWRKVPLPTEPPCQLLCPFFLYQICAAKFIGDLCVIYQPFNFSIA